MTNWLLSIAAISINAKSISFDSADDEVASELCQTYFREFHNVEDTNLITNDVINNGHEGSVYRCACDDPKVQPPVVAQKLFFDRKLEEPWTNMTQMKLVREEVSAAGLGAQLFWYHDRGYFEEFLGHKKDLKDHPTGLTLADKKLWTEHAAQIGKLHTVKVDNIDKAGYTTKFFAEDRGPGGTNTREIIHHFQAIETSTKDCGGDKMISFLNAMSWTYSEYKENISWLENLIRGYFDDQEIPVLSHNDATTGNVMMDKNDTSGESLILIDFDLATYGYRGFDSAFVMQQISNQMVKDGVSDSFMSDEDINEWLSIYKDNVGDENLTTDELFLEFNLFMPYVALEKL